MDIAPVHLGTADGGHRFAMEVAEAGEELMFPADGARGSDTGFDR
jgi:hypothetical protein